MNKFIRWVGIHFGRFFIKSSDHTVYGSAFRGGVELAGTSTVKGDGGDYSRSELVLTANRTDNGMDYR
jgi:hypothetical protein